MAFVYELEYDPGTGCDTRRRVAEAEEKDARTIANALNQCADEWFWGEYYVADADGKKLEDPKPKSPSIDIHDIPF